MVSFNSMTLLQQETPQKPKFRFSPDATPFVPKNFHAEKLVVGEAKSSTLSVEAQEFYPRQYVHQPEKRTVNAASEVRRAIMQLTSNPADFDEVMFMLVTMLTDSMHDNSIIETIVEDLFVQSVSEKNFRYTGARMCGYLSSRLQPNYGLCFQDCLVVRCRNEFSFLQTAMSVSNLPHIIGFALYLGELLVNMKDVRSGVAYIPELAQLVAHLINVLLNFRSDESVRTIVQILKLSGPALEQAVPMMDALCAQIHNVTCDPLTPQHLSVMLSDVLALRSTNWGRNVTDAPGLAASYSATANDEVYLFDDNALCDEFDFLNNLTDSDDQLSPVGSRTEYWAGDDIMDSETAAAFELFMAESKQTSSASSRTVLPNCHSRVTSGHP